MIVRTLEDLKTLGRIKYPADKSFRSARFLTASDDMGFSYNENKVARGTTLKVWLKNHWEANYIVSGKGEVTNLTSGERWPLEAGVLYVVGPNDQHRLSFIEDECHISIFFPPLSGDERFDEDGSYEPSGPIEKTNRRMFIKRLDDLRESSQGMPTENGGICKTVMLSDIDAIGFGLEHICLSAGAEITPERDSSPQAYHVLAGSGEVVDLASGDTRQLAPSMAISTSPTDRCIVRAATELQLLKVVSHPSKHS